MNRPVMSLAWYRAPRLGDNHLGSVPVTKSILPSTRKVRILSQHKQPLKGAVRETDAQEAE